MVARSEHCRTMQGVLAVALVCLVAVDSFTFPGDWHKIRQMMEARREAEAEVLPEAETIFTNIFNRMTDVS